MDTDIGTTRYLGPAEGAEDAHPRAQGEGTEEVSAGSLGASPGPAHHGPATALLVVDRELAGNLVQLPT